MTQYKYTIGWSPQSVVGNLTWNANGSLAQLAITDPFNSANQQTCNYAHDDLARIAAANCGSAAAQTFTYDAFGNINKAGSPYSFNAAYSSATNHITSVGGSTPTYDANGNITNDFLHTYTWNASGRPATIDTMSLTYDAMGRMVEQGSGGTYTEVMYDPRGGKLALMNGQTLVKARLPLPSGGRAVYTGSGLAYYTHADWLGSERFFSTPSSRTMSGDVAYAPFGETYASSGTPDASFTVQNADTVGGDYDFLFREYSIQGRWASPDPAGLAAVDPGSPQSWNRYAYVRNAPSELTDPFGLWSDGKGDDCPWDAACGPTPFINLGLGGLGSARGSGGGGGGSTNHGGGQANTPMQSLGSSACGMPGIATPPIMPGTYPGYGSCSGGIDPRLIILNITVGANGQTVGDYLNEVFIICNGPGVCVPRFWNTYTRSWQSSRADDPGMQALGQAGIMAGPAQYLVVGMFPPAC